MDDEDFEWLSRWRWHLTHYGYVARDEIVDGKQRRVAMHRVILGLAHGDPREGDHGNRNKRDNRRGNLIVVTKAENGQNLA
ncbi:MAG TPA: HNH endonuclease, partial [Usitatibacter sp.]